MDPGYPRHMERWRGVPEKIDAVTTWKDGQFPFEMALLDYQFYNIILST